MSGNSLHAGKLKVSSFTLVLPKAQKVFWTVNAVGNQNSLITVTQEAQVKQTTQNWTQLTYSFALSPDATVLPELEFSLATKQSSIEKRKDLLASAIIDLNERANPQTEPFSLNFELVPGYQASLVFSLHSPSLLCASILSDDLQVINCALEDVKSLFSKAELASRFHEFLATQDVMNALFTSTRSRVESEQMEYAAIEPILIEIWQKLFEVSIFTRAGSIIHGMPSKVVELIGNAPEDIIQGNLMLKLSLLDAVKQITAIKPGIALLPQFCHLLQMSIQQAIHISIEKDASADEKPSTSIQRLIGTLIRVLVSFDPKYITWITREGNILTALKELLFNWKHFDSQLLKQVNQLLMFFGSSCASLLDEVRIQPLLETIAEQSVDIPLQLSCQKAITLIWFKPEPVVIPDAMVSNLPTSTAVERMSFFQALSKAISAVQSSKEKLEILLNFLAPKESDTLEFMPSDISSITQICETFQPSHRDLLETNFFKIFSALLAHPSSPLPILTNFMDFWRNARPSTESFDPPKTRLDSRCWNLRSPSVIHESLPPFAKSWDLSKKIDFTGLSEQDELQMAQEQSLLLDSSFFTAIQPHLQSSSFKPYFMFFLSILWHQPTLLQAVQASTGNQFLKTFREAIVKKKKKHSSEVLMLLILLAIEFEAVTDDAYLLPKPKAAIQSGISGINDYDFGVWSQEIDRFRDIFSSVTRKPKQSFSYFLGVDKVLIKLAHSILLEIKEVSTLIEFEKLEDVEEGDSASKIHRHWLGLCSLFDSIITRLSCICSSLQISFAVVMNMMTLIDQKCLNGYFLPVIGSLITAGAAMSNSISAEGGDSVAHVASALMSPEMTLSNILNAVVFYSNQEKDDQNSMAALVLALVSSMLGQIGPSKRNGPKLPFRQLLDFAKSIRGCEENPVLIAHVELIYTYFLRHAPQKDENGKPDSTIFYCPESIAHMVQFLLSRVARHDKRDQPLLAYEAMYFFIRWWPQIRHSIFCKAVPLEEAAEAYRKDFLYLNSKIKSLSADKIANNWDMIRLIVELYYVPHMLEIEPTEYTKLLEQLHQTLQKNRRYHGRKQYNAANFLILVETLLDIGIMLPYAKSLNSAVNSWQYKVGYNSRIPSEHIIRKTFYSVRRTAFVRTSWNMWYSLENPHYGTWMFQDWYRLLKYPTCLTMLGKAVLSSGTDLASSDRTRFLMPADSMHVDILNAMYGLVAQLQQMEENPANYFLTQQHHMQIYAPISVQITRQGLEVDDVEKPMFKVETSNGAVPRENLRDHYLPPFAFAESVWAPLTRFSKDYTSDFGRWFSQGYDDQDTLNGYFQPNARFPKPLFFDEYPIFDQLAETDRSLSERDLIFSRQYDACLKENGLFEIVSEDELKDAKSQLFSGDLFPKFVPTMVYRNHLKKWFDSAFIAPGEDEYMEGEPECRDTTPIFENIQNTAEDQSTDSSSVSCSLSDKSSISSDSLEVEHQLQTTNPSIPSSSHGATPTFASDSSITMDTEKLGIIHKNARQQLIGALDAMLEVLYCCLTYPKYGLKRLAVHDEYTVFSPSFDIQNSDMMAEAMFSLIGQFVRSSKSREFDVYSSKRLNFESWIPASTHWKWLGCMARIYWILPDRAQVFCGKLISHLMKLDVGLENSSASLIGTPMYDAIAVFGKMSCNPNINPLAPRLIGMDVKDPVDGFEAANNKKRKRHSKRIAGRDLPPPSTIFFFEDIENVPSYLVKYLPMLLDEIELGSGECFRSHEKDKPCCANQRRLWDILVTMTRDHASSCFQLVEFGLNQLLKDSLQPYEVDRHRPDNQQIAQLLSILVRTKGDFERAMTVKSWPLLGTEPKTVNDIFKVGFGTGMALAADEKLALAPILRHLPDGLLLQPAFNPIVMEFAVKLISTMSIGAKLQMSFLPILPFLKIERVLRIFTFAPSVFVTTICGHPGMSPAEVNSFCSTLLAKSHEYQFELRQALLRWNSLYASKSTYLLELFGDSTAQERQVKLPPLDYSFATDLEECQAHLIFVCGEFLARDPVEFKKVATKSLKDKGKKLLKQLQYPLYDKFASGTLVILPLVLKLLLEGEELLRALPLKANGSLWAIPSLRRLPANLDRSMQPFNEYDGPQYGVSVVDRVVTIWFEDRGVTLPSSLKALKQSKKSPSASYDHPCSSVLSFRVLPAATKNPMHASQQLSHCRFGYASLQAIAALKNNGLQGIGEVPESWAISNDQSQIWSEGSCSDFNISNLERDTFVYCTKPITMAYHQYRNEIIVDNLVYEPSFISSTHVSIPLPSNRENLTIYPCISFYHPRRFFVIPGCHPGTE